MNRRDLLKTGLVAGAALAFPTRALAQFASPFAARDRQLFDIANEGMARAGKSLWMRDRVGIADFGLHSAMPRFHFVDMVNQRVDSFLVAHGTGSDWEHDGWLKRYSNIPGSEATSKGAYQTRSWYTGKYGTSIRLDGLDPTNSNALPRAIVMHQASYATPEHVATYGRLGRSNGCLAMGPQQFQRALIELAGGRLIIAASLGLMPDGNRVPPPVTQYSY